MKRIVILSIMALFCTSSFAQRSNHRHALPVNTVNDGNTLINNNTYARTTTVGDTLHMSNIASAATIVLYSAGADSGYLTGTNYWNDQAFAERYDFNGEDSSVRVIGVFAQYGGKVNPASSDSVTFNVWSVGTPQYITSNLFYSGFPASVLTAQNVPVIQLGIGITADTLKAFMFDSATNYLTNSFFVGYNINYNFAALTGDTIGLASSLNGDRTSPATTIQVTITGTDTTSDTTIDTFINVQNATQWSDNNWHDNYTDNDSLYNDLVIYPIVVIGNTSGVKGVTKRGLTFFGNYPNPAVNSTNIKYTLAATADVTIQILDMAGHVLNTITQTSLSAGDHITTVNTSDLATGNYLYLIRTSHGDGIAGKMTIVK